MEKYFNKFVALPISIMLFILLISFPKEVKSQWISPGDLSEAHKDLEGILNCTSCHIIGDKIQPEKCLTCHSKLELQLEEKRGYHYENRDKSCTQCHQEHRGRNFDLITLDEDNFAEEHDSLGFKLEGKHLELECVECHKTPGTYRGLDKNCLSCHEDNYHGRLGNTCIDCHSFDSFKPSTFEHKENDLASALIHQKVECLSCHINGQYKGLDNNCNTCHKDEHKGQLTLKCENCHPTTMAHFEDLEFDHNTQSEFNLKEKHNTLACNECHKSGIYEYNYNNCTTCHEDEHKGEIKEDCSLCHSETGFDKSTFEHKEPFYELTGAHKTLNCNECHTTQHYAGTSKVCVDCHEDEHKEEVSSDCESCHTQDTFSPSTFEHEKPNFELFGKHKTLDCYECHSTTTFATVDYTCIDCHKEEHKGQLSTDCETCHNNDSFKPSTYKHEKTDFQMLGEHKNTNCEDCHTLGRFHPLSNECSSCHTDVHDKKLGEDCTICHIQENWEEIIYDHNENDFTLLGRHKIIRCEECHENENFELTRTNCYDCHSDPHLKSFGNDCESCHTQDSWAVLNYNHDIVNYPLVGMHEQAACSDCHTALQKTVTGKTCYECHKSDYNNAIEPFHRGANFGNDCESCHRNNDISWSEGNWEEHESIFPRSTSSAGHHDNYTCSECHPNNENYRKYNCLSCHERGEMKDAHKDVRRYKYQNTKCFDCHPVGEIEDEY